MKKKIVIISNYYPPEMGAAANRIKNMAEGLLHAGNDVTVLCPLPNYPKGEIYVGYKNKFKVIEEIEGIYVRRYWLYPSNSKNAFIRFFSMISFSISLWSSFFKLHRNKPDLFIIQSPPLFIAFSGLLLSKLLRVRNVLNVSDIWPLSALELGALKKGFLYRVLTKVEKWNYKFADKIIGQSDEIISHIKKFTNKEFLVYRNTPNYIAYATKQRPKGNLKIVYAGLLGFAQDIYTICTDIDFKNLGVEFHIYGAGMDAECIEGFARNKENNIFFHGHVSSFQIKEEIRKYDIAIIPLKNRIYGAVPSKIFEMMQLGVPILYTEKGEAAKIIEQFHLGIVDYHKNRSNAIINGLRAFMELSSKEYGLMSANGISQHKKVFHLDRQLERLRHFID